MSSYNSEIPVRQTYHLLKETGPNWHPKGIPSMYNQTVAITPDMGYQALTHAVSSPSSGYFSVGNAYNTEFIKTCGYKFVQRPCDGYLKK